MIRETIETEVLESSKSRAGKTSDLPLWDYVEALKPEDFSRHILYVYRQMPNGQVSPTTKLTMPVDEFGFKELCGGGTYKLLLKNGPQIIKRMDNFVIEGKSKNPDDETHAPTANHSHNNSGGNNTAVDRLCDLLTTLISNQNGGSAMGEAMRGALQLQADGFKSVVTNVRELTPQAPAASPFGGMTDMIGFLSQCKNLFGGGGGGGIKETLEMIVTLKEAGLVGGGEGKFSFGQELLRLAPQALGQIGQGLTAMADAKKAEANAAIILAGGRPPIPVGAPAPTPALPAPATTTPPPATPPMREDGVVSPNVEWVQLKISEIITDDNLSVTEAAEESITFLEMIAPAILQQLIAAGETGMQFLFNNQPILAKVPKSPRLTEFIAKFLELAKEPAADNSSTTTVPQTA